VGAAILLEPSKYVGKAIALTGPHSVDMYDLAKEYSAVLGRHISYVEVPLESWKEKVKQMGIPDHAYQHIVTMAKLHEDGDYDRFTDSVQEVLGRPAASISATIKAPGSNFLIPASS
jgi:uncharacterized protein YbjT (DUF2867 family)